MSNKSGAKGGKVATPTASLYADEQPLIVACPNNQVSGALLFPYSRLQRERFLADLGHAAFMGHSEARPAHIGSGVVEQLARVSVPIAEGLRRGQLFEMVGSPRVIEGLKNGSLSMMRSGEGTLGTVIHRSSGRIAGQARFNPTRIAGPAVLWSVVSAVTATAHLNQIHRALEDLQGELSRLSEGLASAELGELCASIEMLEEIGAEWKTTGRLSMISGCNLSAVEIALRRLYHSSRFSLGSLRTRANEVQMQGGKKGLKHAKELAEAQSQEAARKMAILVATARADLRLQELRIRVQMLENPADVERRVRWLEERIAIYRGQIEGADSMNGLIDHAHKCAASLSRWERLTRRWKFWKPLHEDLDSLDRLRPSSQKDGIMQLASGSGDELETPDLGEILPRIVFYKRNRKIETIALEPMTIPHHDVSPRR